MVTAPSIIVRPYHSVGLWAELRQLWQYRALIRVLVQRDLRVRYKNSVLGIGWSLVPALMQVLVLTVFLEYILDTGPSNQSVYILCGFVPWTFFQTAVLDSSTAVLAQFGLLKKVYFPREIPIIASVCASFVHFLISLGFFIVYRWLLAPLLFHSHGIVWPGWPPREVLWLPVIVLLLFLLTLGVGFFVSAWNVFYEDVKFILTMTLQFLFYLLPIINFSEKIFYSPRLGSLSKPLYNLYLANPLAWIVTAFKQIFFGRQNINHPGQPVVLSAPFDYRYFAIATVLSVLIFLAGYTYFNKRKWKFTERP